MIKKELHAIRYSFSKDELAEKSTQLADACGEKARLTEEKKSVVSDFKAKIDAKESIIGMLSNHITSGYEIKTVECEVEVDYDKGLKRYFYQGVLYDTRPLGDEERQLPLEPEME
jgi:hypothetical protein